MGQSYGIEVMELDGKKWVSYLAFQELTEERDSIRKDADEMRRNKFLSDAEIEEISRLRKEHGEMRERLNDLTVFMREHYKEEIDLGQHAVMRDSVAAAMFYMGRERILSRQRSKGASDGN